MTIDIMRRNMYVKCLIPNPLNHLGKKHNYIITRKKCQILSALELQSTDTVVHRVLKQITSVILSPMFSPYSYIPIL